MIRLESDVLVIGAGGAGIYAAIAAARDGCRVHLIDRSLIGRGGATVMAQMTVAVALGEQCPDHWEYHLADTLKAKLILASVAPLLVTPDPYGGVDVAYDPDEDRAERRIYLEGIAEKLRKPGRDVSIQDAFGQVDWTLLEVAREQGADLIAIASHGSGGVTRLIMGSVASSIVQRAPLPLLIVRPAVPSEEPDSSKGGETTG